MEKEEELGDQTEIAKFMIDEYSDFQLSAAYETYSRIWEKDPPLEVKKQLNRAISQLSEKKMDYDTFYYTINEYRKGSFNPGRGRIQTQRKRDWRKKEARKRKNGRYKR